MLRQNIGALITLFGFIVLVCINVRVTSRYVDRPDSSQVKQRLKHHYPRFGAAVLAFLGVVSSVAVFATAMYYTFHLPLQACVVFGLFFWMVVSLPTRAWVRLVLLVLFLALVTFVGLQGGVLAAQAVMGLFLLALMGAGSVVPAALGSYHTALPRYDVVSVPLWLTVLAGTGIFDAVLAFKDISMTDAVGDLLGFASVQAVDANGPGVTLWEAALYSEPSYHLGLLSPVAMFMMFSVLAMWRNYMGHYAILKYPFVGWWVGVAASVISWLVLGEATAGVYAGIGLIVGTLFGVAKSRMWDLIMMWSQDWHADQTHKLVGYDELVRSKAS